MQETTISVSKRGFIIVIICFCIFFTLSSSTFYNSNISGKPSYRLSQNTAFASSGAATEETKPVKYSIWQDFCAVIFAAIIIASAYTVIKRFAAKPQKEEDKHPDH